MGFKTILEVDGVIRNVLNFRIEYFVPDYKLKDTNKSFWSIDDYRSLPLASWRMRPHDPVGGLLEITLESTSHDDEFWDWLGNNQKVPAKNGKIVIFSADEEFMPLRVLEFWDCFLINIAEHFNSVGGSPMTFSIRLSPGILQIDRGALISRYWKWTDFEEKTNLAFQEDLDPRVTRIYWMDEYEKNKIEKFNVGQNVLLIAETEGYNMNDTIELSIENKRDGKIVKVTGQVDYNNLVKIEWKV